MGMNFGNITKVSFQTDIKRKQALFNRCKRRFKVATTAGERQFLKGEASRIVSELKQCSKKWKNFGFGAFTWITKNYTVTKFAAGSPSATRKATARKCSAGRTTGHRIGIGSSAKRSGSTRPKARTRSQSKASRRTYVAW